MSLHRLLPNSAKNQLDLGLKTIIFMATVEWHWSWKQFQETPIPVILGNLKMQKEKADAQKRKK